LQHNAGVLILHHIIFYVMSNLPIYIPIVFILTTLLTVGFFYRASEYRKVVLLIAGGWLLLQGLLAGSGFYTVTDTVPPRFLLLVLPPLLLTVGLLATRRGWQWAGQMDQGTLTLLHTVRIPVELVLFWLYQHKGVPQLMTFEGRNFDILSGITAPVIYYLGYYKKSIPAKWMLVWNLLCLGLLLNIVIHAVLSAPFSFQQLAFDQPNIAVLHWPYALLPGCIVPLVLIAHWVAIGQLLRKR
jgi:hypothetical protein